MTKRSVVALSPEQMEAKGKFPSRLFREEGEICAYLWKIHRIKLSVSTLAVYACKGKGPPYRVAGRRPLYDQDAIDSWALEYLGTEATSRDRAAVA